MRHRTGSERKTVISWNHEERVVHIASHDPVVWRRLARLGIDPTGGWRYRDGVEATRFYELPLTDFRWGLKRRSKGVSGCTNRPLQGVSKSKPDAVHNRPLPVEIEALERPTADTPEGQAA